MKNIVAFQDISQVMYENAIVDELEWNVKPFTLDSYDPDLNQIGWHGQTGSLI